MTTISANRDRPEHPILLGYPRPIWVLLSAVLVNRLGVMVGPMLTLYLRDRGFDERTALSSGSFYALGATISAYPAGLLADRLGRRGSIVLVMSGASLAIFALSRCRELGSLLTGIFFVGLFAEAYRPAVTAMLTDLVEPARRLPVFALQRTVVNFGHATGPFLGGLLAAHQMYGWIFTINACTTAAFAAIAALFLPETRPSLKAPPIPTDKPKTRFNKVFLWFCLGLLPVSSAYFQVLFTLPIHLRDHLPSLSGAYASAVQTLVPGMAERLLQPPAVFGALLFLNGALIVCFEYLLSLRLRRFSAHHVMIVGAVLTGLGLVVVGVFPTVDAAFLGVIITTAGEMCFAPSALAFVTHIAPVNSRARYMAMFGLVHGMALVLAPTAAGQLLPSLGPLWFWPMIGGSAFLGAIAFAALPDTREHSQVRALQPAQKD